MPFGPFLLAVALLAGGAPRAAPDEFGDRLAQLGSPHADDRAAAERWLAAHLAPEHYAALAAAARAGDAEIRGRLQRVLGADPRHLGLALGLAAERDPDLARLGVEAVRAGVARRAPRLAGPVVRGKDLEELLARIASQSPPRFLRVVAGRPLEEVVTELELVGELPLGLTVAPEVAARTLRREDAALGGPWNELLLALASGLGVGLECHGLGLESAQPDPAGAFLRLGGDPEARTSGVDVLADWLVALASGTDETVRVRAARNLAASGFAPALEWMDARARAGDRAALEGLLRAAARGRAAPALATAPILEGLLAEAAAGGPGSARILCGLAHGTCVDAAGAPLVPRLLADLSARPARERWARLFVLERRGCATPELDAAADALLAAPDTPPALRLEALFVAMDRPRADAERPAATGLAELFRLPLAPADTDRLGQALVALGLAPPHADPATIPAAWGPSERLALIQAFLWSGARDALAAHAGAFLDGPAEGALARGEALAAALHPWLSRGAAPLVRDVLARAGTGARTAAVLRVRLLLGLVPVAEVPAALAALGWTPEASAGDLALLGSLAALPGPPEVAPGARERLLSELTVTLRTRQTFADGIPLVVALERAAQGLYATGLDEEGERFARDVRRTFRAEPRSELTRRLERSLWPPAPGTETRDLGIELGRYAVPAGL